MAVVGRSLDEGEELAFYHPFSDPALTLGSAVTHVHLALDDPDHPRLEGFVESEEMARAVTAGIQMLEPSYSLLALGIEDIKRSALRSRHIAAYRELTSDNHEA